MIGTLDRKLIRDLWQLRGPALAILLVVAAGIAVFVTSLGAIDSLEITRAVYYDDYRFSHVFARLVRAPNSLSRRIAEVPGVAQVQTRTVIDVSLQLDNVAEPSTGRFISIPERKTPMLNDIYIRAGRYIEPGRDEEVLLSEAFADAHDLHPYDHINAVINGRLKRLTIVGIALSPEYVYQISGKDPWPDDKRFAILWMGREALAAALDMTGAFNDLSLTLAKGASEDNVIAAVDQLLSPYGSLGAYGRSRQISDRFLSDELQQLRNMAVVVPSIFLAIAAFLINVVLSRVVSTQRSQIATLKAFGYTNTAIGMHYLKMALLLVLAGAIVGGFVGLWLATGMTRLYAEYFRFPVLALQVTPSTVALGALVSVVAASIGVLAAVRRAVKLAPAEAMQPEPPATFKPSLFERLGLHRMVSPATRMIVRNVARRPARAILSAVGVAFAVSLLIIGSFSEDSVRYMMDLQFRVTQGEDATVILNQPRSRDALREIQHLPGVVVAEPFRAVAVTLHHNHHARDTSLLGVDPDATLHRLVDKDMQVVSIHSTFEGLILSQFLAKQLAVGVGDLLTVEVLEGRKQVHVIPITMVLDDLVGASAYLRMGALHRLMAEGDVVSGAYISVDPLYKDNLYAKLNQTPGVAGVAIREAALQSFEKTMAENMGVMRSIQIIFAAIIAFSIVYNNARIALAERSRELASLRVLGFSRAEVSLILLGELSVITVLAIPLGLGLGYLFAWSMTEGYQTEMFRLPLVIHGSTYAYATIVVLLSAIASALVVRRRIDQLDLVAVLKTRD